MRGLAAVLVILILGTTGGSQNLTAYVTGTVVDSYGQPVMGAMVRAYRYIHGSDGQRTFVGAGPLGETDDRGIFQGDLAPGDYVFRIEKSRPDTDIRDPYVPLHYPRSQTGSAVETVKVLAGATTSLPRILLSSALGSRVHVSLVDDSGESPPVGFVALRRKDDPSWMTQTNVTSPSGFYARLPQGSYEVEAGVLSATNPQNASLRERDSAYLVRTSLEVRDKDIDLPIKLPRGTRVEGRLTKRAKDGTVTPAPGVQVRLNGEGFNYLSMILGVATAADGTFSFASVPTGSFRFAPLAPQGFCVSEIRQNDSPLADDKLIVSSASVTLTALLKESNTRIEGTVLDTKGQPARGAVVALLPDDRSQSRNFFETTADQNGRFEFTCASPGAYRVFAWTSLPGAAYRNEEFMAAYKDRGTELRLAEGASATIRTELIER